MLGSPQSQNKHQIVPKAPQLHKESEATSVTFWGWPRENTQSFSFETVKENIHLALFWSGGNS